MAIGTVLEVPIALVPENQILRRICLRRTRYAIIQHGGQYARLAEASHYTGLVNESRKPTWTFGGFNPT